MFLFLSDLYLTLQMGFNELPAMRSLFFNLRPCNLTHSYFTENSAK